jgi:hypothetical protein
VKNAKRDSRKTETPSQKQRTAALRALNETALKEVKGGGDPSVAPPSSDPIC